MSYVSAGIRLQDLSDSFSFLERGLKAPWLLHVLYSALSSQSWYDLYITLFWFCNRGTETLKNPFDTPWTGHIWVAKAKRDRVHFNENWAVSQLEIQRETGPVWLTLLSSALLWQAPSFTEVCTCNNKAPFLSSHLVAWDLPDLMSRCLHLFFLSFSLFLVALCAWYDVCRHLWLCFMFLLCLCCQVDADKQDLTNKRYVNTKICENYFMCQWAALQLKAVEKKDVICCTRWLETHIK